jgi:hypothetical protein
VPVRVRLSVDEARARRATNQLRSSTPSLPVAPYTTRLFRALTHDFAVQTSDRSLASYLDALLDALSIAGEPSGPHYSFVEEQLGPERVYSVFYGPSRLVQCTDPSVGLDWLLWHIQARAMSLSGQWLVVHAGAVAALGHAVLLPGPTGAGKTTLVAGLVAAGLGYLSDDAVPLSGSPPVAHPYARPLSLKPGTHELLAQLEPRAPSAVARHLGPQWHVPVSSIRPQAVAPSCRPAFVVAPIYEPGGRTRLEPMTRADALVVLIRNTLNFGVQGSSKGLVLLRDVVNGADCHRLVAADLDAACQAVLELVMRGEASAG